MAPGFSFPWPRPFWPDAPKPRREPVPNGTGTGVGKTFVAIEYCTGCAIGMEPICCGDREDAHRLLAASAEGISIEELNPSLAAIAGRAVSRSLDRAIEIDLGKISGLFSQPVGAVR